MLLRSIHGLTARGGGGAARLALPRAALLATAAVVLAPAQASNTAPTRSFTTEFACDNGRRVLLNAHPRRPREEAWLTYAGNRVEVRLVAGSVPPRYQDKDGKAVWQTQGADSASFTFRGLVDAPVACTRIPATHTK
jgi:hypothetical protein